MHASGSVKSLTYRKVLRISSIETIGARNEATDQMSVKAAGKIGLDAKPSSPIFGCVALFAALDLHARTRTE
jgi:hypothetical protein